MAVKLPDISSKTGKKCICHVFQPFLTLCRTASRLYRLSQSNALCINQFYSPKNQSKKFLRKNFEKLAILKNALFSCLKVKVSWFARLGRNYFGFQLFIILGKHFVPECTNISALFFAHPLDLFSNLKCCISC